MTASDDVTNQPPPLIDLNLFETDRALGEAVSREGAGWAEGELSSFGAQLGRVEAVEAGRLANAHPPILHLFDRYGHRRDEVEFHPAYHQLMAMAVRAGLHTGPWSDPRPGAHVARGAGVILMCQVEAGVQCPTTMTYGVVPVLKRQPEIARDWLPRLYSRGYDPRFLPAAEKTGAMMGMGMTEKQGGSDLRANTTRAMPLDARGPGAAYRIDGHKWFFSAPMCDAFLILAQAPDGLSCFFLPRFLPDGTRNALHLQRLKDKTGNRANASSEVEFHDATAWLVGEEGRGIPTIIEMGNYTRLDCALGTAGLMRQAVAQAIHHAAHRTAFRKHLIDQPLMANVLADIALESEAATALALRLARAYDRQDDPAEAGFARLMTPAAKYWICKRGPPLAAEAMEVLGGNGYVEEAILARLYREMPLNSIWEGSGNVMCLDAVRAARKSPDSIDAVIDEVELCKGAHARMDAHIDTIKDRLRTLGSDEGSGRREVEAIAKAVQASLLLRFSPHEVSDAFIASRLSADGGMAFGTLPPGIDTRSIAERHRPNG